MRKYLFITFVARECLFFPVCIFWFITLLDYFVICFLCFLFLLSLCIFIVIFLKNSHTPLYPYYWFIIIFYPYFILSLFQPLLLWFPKNFPWNLLPCSGCRVIARLMRERDEARAMLASANINMTNTAAAAAAYEDVYNERTD